MHRYLSDLPLTAVAGIFVVAAIAVWLAGVRLSRYADGLAARTGIGRVVIGALMLGGITSLPELATSVTASVNGDADMAVNNLFGGIAMQVAVLAAVDAALGAEPFSRRARAPIIGLEGVFLIVVLGLAMGGMIIGEPTGFPIGLWSGAMLITALAAFGILHGYRERAAAPQTGEATGTEASPHGPPADDALPGPGDPPEPALSIAGLVLRAGIAALVILAAGYAITVAGETIASRTDLGSGFVGAALIAASTSLPELSTTIAAARLGRYDMAFSNIFGANILDAGLVFVVDLAYDGPAVLGLLGDFALLAALLGVVLTAIYVAGALHGRVRSHGRMGTDSIAVLALYLAGLYALFQMR